MGTPLLSAEIDGKRALVCGHCNETKMVDVSARIPEGFCSQGCALSFIACLTRHPNGQDAAGCLGKINKTSIVADCSGVVGSNARLRFYGLDGKIAANAMIPLELLPGGVRAGMRLRLVIGLIGMIEG